MSFGSPKAPKPKPPPLTPTRADAAKDRSMLTMPDSGRMAAGVRTTNSGLTTPAERRKRSLIGGG